MNQRRQKLIIVAAVAALVILIGLGIFASLRHRGETAINIVTAPEDSIITIDGRPAKAGRNYLKPGVHALKASRQYFTDVTQTVNTKDLSPGQDVYLLPGADTPEAIDWLNKNPEAQALRESVGGARAAAGSAAIAEKYPFLEGLPRQTLDYKIDYSIAGGDQAISFQVTLYPVATEPGTPEYKRQLEGFKQEALKFLQSLGIDIKKAKISFEPDPEHL